MALVLYASPAFGITIYIALLAWYPVYLTIPIGTIDFTVCRVVIIAIYANIFLRTRLHHQLKLVWLDKLVVIYFCCQIVAGLQTVPTRAFLENRSGAILDEALVYFAIRMVLTQKVQYLRFLKSILIVAAPLGLVGFYQCLTGINPVGFLQKYAAFGAALEYIPVPRYGFYRANVTFGETIMFGLFFAMLGSVCAGLLRSVRSHKWVYFVGLGLMGAGAFSAISTGALLAVLIAFVFMVYYPCRRYWKWAVAIILLGCGTVEIISNRHVYDVLGEFSFNPANAWYRSRLINVVFQEGGMSGHWWTGFGFGDPGWGPQLDGRNETDIVNHYLAVLCRYGVVGLVPFLALILAANRQLLNSWRTCTSGSERWLVWCLAGAVFGTMAAMMSVSLFGPAITVFHILLGFCGSIPSLVGEEDATVLRQTRRHVSSYAPILRKVQQTPQYRP